MGQPQISDASKSLAEEEKKGFTIIEVMIFLAISGLLLMGVLSGTYLSISRQRYNDSVRGFAEFLRQVYGEVISPESLGDTGDSYGGNSDSDAIYGKVIVFGLNNQTTAYTATLVGNVDIPAGNQGFLKELSLVDARLFCGIEDAAGNVVNDTTVDSYTPLWESQIVDPSGNILKGTVIIARSPTSGTVHTVYNPNFSPDLADPSDCHPGGTQAASISLRNEIKNDVDHNLNSFQTTDINFCIKSDQSKIIRDIVLAADGRNNTAINLLDEADARNVCR